MPDAQPLRPGDPATLGAFRIVGRIGEGGQGVVYLGEAESGGLVAVKFFLTRLDQDPAFADGFMQELEVAKRVARFCTAQVLDSGISDDRPYIVSEYVPGPSLREVVLAEGPRSGSALERLAISTITALVALHDAGVVHRDLKPQNVLIGPDGPRVIDFGIARALVGSTMMASQVVGTPAYMAPEQLSGGELGHAVDVFAWASTIAFAATGRPPFGNDAIPVIMNRILTQEPDLEGVEAPLRDLLTECFAKDPLLRPSAQHVLDRLVRASGQVTGPAQDPSQVSAEGTQPPGMVPDERRVMRAGVVPVLVSLGLAALVVIVVALMPGDGVSALRSGITQTLPESVATVELPTVTPGHDPTSPAPTPVVVATTPEVVTPPQIVTGLPEPVRSPTSVPRTNASPKRKTTTAKPTRKPTRKPTAKPTASSKPVPTKDPTASDPPPSKQPSAKPSAQLAELGAGHFTPYCQKLGWEWDEYRETPKPGSYCVKRKNDETMFLSQGQLDAGCQWRFNEPRAFHRYKGKSNWCYVYR
jgi:serine/threonine protein kinase